MNANIDNLMGNELIYFKVDETTGIWSRYMENLLSTTIIDLLNKV